MGGVEGADWFGGHSCSGGQTLLGGAPALVGHLHGWPQGQTIPRAWEGGPAWVLRGQPAHLLDVQDVTGQAVVSGCGRTPRCPSPLSASILGLGGPAGPSQMCRAPKDRGSVRMKNFCMSKGIIKGTQEQAAERERWLFSSHPKPALYPGDTENSAHRQGKRASWQKGGRPTGVPAAPKHARFLVTGSAR